MEGRSKKSRDRAKFDYHISIDRPVCKAVFLFYYFDFSKRLERLKSCVTFDVLTIPVHGNSGRIPANAYDNSSIEKVKSFILNFATIHGLPDPGRDIRIGPGKLRMLLPSVIFSKSVHLKSATSIKVSGEYPIAYRTFLKIFSGSILTY